MSEKPVTVEQALLESMRYPKEAYKGTIYILRDGTQTRDRKVALAANKKLIKK